MVHNVTETYAPQISHELALIAIGKLAVADIDCR